jgi:hypothetical protein
MREGAKWCRHCCRIGARTEPCRNTRDMDPVDGNNHDPACHAALVAMGGGERGRSADDFKPRYQTTGPKPGDVISFEEAQNEKGEWVLTKAPF